MAIQTKVFPLNMRGIEGGPRFKTQIIEGKNKQEVRNALWQDALWKYNLAYAVRSRADAEALVAFFLTGYGQEKAFLLQAGDDYKIPSSGSTPQSIGTGNGSNRDFQMKKRYTSGAYTYDRTIIRPSTTDSDIEFYVNGILTPGRTYSTTTGIINANVAPGNGLDVALVLKKFYVVVRFETDELDIDMLYWWVDNTGADTSHHQFPNIPVIEVRDTT